MKRRLVCHCSSSHQDQVQCSAVRSSVVEVLRLGRRGRGHCQHPRRRSRRRPGALQLAGCFLSACRASVPRGASRLPTTCPYPLKSERCSPLAGNVETRPKFQRLLRSRCCYCCSRLLRPPVNRRGHSQGRYNHASTQRIAWCQRLVPAAARPLLLHLLLCHRCCRYRRWRHSSMTALLRSRRAPGERGSLHRQACPYQLLLHPRESSQKCCPMAASVAASKNATLVGL
mmetsp:Transcript_20733/g.44238  ORF Transcript_20733/g.44238 Transcript_20733/m.44238 type:complete len:229 (+) Transcript_20733:1536-2222(+)